MTKMKELKIITIVMDLKKTQKVLSQVKRCNKMGRRNSLKINNLIRMSFFNIHSQSRQNRITNLTNR